MVEKKVVYVVTFISHSYLLVKVHRMRYSDAEKLHTKVLKTIEQLRITASIPAFPGKRLFGSHNDTKQGILTRVSIPLCRKPNSRSTSTISFAKKSSTLCPASKTSSRMLRMKRVSFSS